MIKQLHLWIEGRVQGVFYRANAVKEGARIGLTGWVRNLPDGRVEALAQGREEQLQAFVKWCWHGPTLAKVKNVQVVEEPANEQMAGFLVLK